MGDLRPLGLSWLQDPSVTIVVTGSINLLQPSHMFESCNIYSLLCILQTKRVPDIICIMHYVRSQHEI